MHGTCVHVLHVLYMYVVCIPQYVQYMKLHHMFISLIPLESGIHVVNMSSMYLCTHYMIYVCYTAVHMYTLHDMYDVNLFWW